ncbi:MAG: hypothetical protein QFX32_08690 [Methanolinea sp.]|nr:hypothetical protein [Methanolinea sp.]
MKISRFFPVLLFLCFAGYALADDPVGATRQTQGITTVTHVVVYGTFTDSVEAVWVTSNQDVRNNPPLNEYADEVTVDGAGRLAPTGNRNWTPERQATMSYSEQTLADNGYIEWDKTVSLDTGDKIANQDNFRTVTHFDFVSAEDAYGRATFSESLLLDSASMGSGAGSRMMCPWGTGDSGFIPAYCNIVEMGSSFTGSRVTMVTTAGERHVSASADVPAGMDYSVSLSGVGSAAAWINAHIMEGRTPSVFANVANGAGRTDYVFWNGDMGDYGFMQGVDLVYKERTTASGVIASFAKAMSYQSGMRRL